jgi:hypothetical protein
MRTTRRLYLGMLAVGTAVLLAASLTQLSAQQNSPRDRAHWYQHAANPQEPGPMVRDRQNRRLLRVLPTGQQGDAHDSTSSSLTPRPRPKAV